MRILAEDVEAEESRALRLELARDLHRRYGGDPGEASFGREDDAAAFYVARGFGVGRSAVRSCARCPPLPRRHWPGPGPLVGSPA